MELLDISAQQKVSSTIHYAQHYGSVLVVAAIKGQIALSHPDPITAHSSSEKVNSGKMAAATKKMKCDIHSTEKLFH